MMSPLHLDTIPLAEAWAEQLDTSLRTQTELLRGGVEPFSLAPEERQLLEHIRTRTAVENRNNVTRTMAYWAMYQAHPELHWALLAHLVSRNGGWNMTDLRGELLPRLIDEELVEHLFAFLERANALIFQDAYPQLLLYDASVRQRKNLFHLLPHLHISMWMRPVWDQFWASHDSALLTIGLIVNEQNYIEGRVVQNKRYQLSVLDKPLFKGQAFLQLNQVGFPFLPLDREGDAPLLRLAGLILENFADLSERIEFGKSLYALLFGVPDVLQGALRFAKATPHTGSRADYWPHLYSPIQKASPDKKYQERLDGCFLKEGSSPLYSPALAAAWPDRQVLPAEPGDWYHEAREPLAHLQPITVPETYDLTEAMCTGIRTIELAIRAAQAMNVR
ncbi:hypothetical protein J2X61_003344 [Bacillus sp. 3255]|nr:hypothetical protein [Bacillus sp. 3255]